jgi:DNA modification methylase
VIHAGDCVDVMAGLPEGSVSAVVTDPPYELGFMGRAWDRSGIAFRPETWQAMLRLTEPGGYLLAFGGTRTVHRIAVAIEDAGWEIRDQIAWIYANGMPKGRTTLKPAHEPIVLARKRGPSRQLGIEAARIGTEATTTKRSGGSGAHGVYGRDERVFDRENAGRWPANVILTDPVFDGDTPGVVGGGESAGGSFPSETKPTVFQRRGYVDPRGPRETDSGTRSRYFLIPKASRAERERGTTKAQRAEWGVELAKAERENVHPTVKPVQLMRHLLRLVVPAGGNVLDPFLGSGTTGIAAELEGIPWQGIERDPEYVAIARARVAGWGPEYARAAAERGQDGLFETEGVG